MKKFWLTLTAIIILLLAAIYLYIPDLIKFENTFAIKANPDAVYRNLRNHANWDQWWPGKDGIDSGYGYNGHTYLPAEGSVYSVGLGISGGGIKAKSLLTVIPSPPDTTRISWKSVVATSYNPFTRISRFFKSKELEEDVNYLARNLNNYLESDSGVYGVRIRQELVMDSNLVFTSAYYREYPNTNEVYQLVDRLRAHINQQGGKETGYPMLNIYPKSDSGFLTRVAIPVDKELKGNAAIHYKQMLGRGDILMMEVTGGNSSLTNGLALMENYLRDNKKTSPAIPFYSLVTDRRKEPDSTKWITRIYYPVM